MCFSCIVTTFPEKLHFRRCFCQITISVEHHSWAISEVCVSYESETSNQVVFLQSTITNDIISWRRPMGSSMLHSVVRGPPCDYAVSISLSIFNPHMNKAFKNTVRYQCHVINQNFYLHTLDSAQISKSSHQSCSVRKGFLRNFKKFTGKHLCQGLFFNKVAGLRPVNFVKFLRTAFSHNTYWRLLVDQVR